jgi:hypothetical protein
MTIFSNIGVKDSLRAEVFTAPPVGKRRDGPRQNGAKTSYVSQNIVATEGIYAPSITWHESCKIPSCRESS